MGREVIDGGVLIEIVGRVGLTLGSGTISDVIVGIRNIVCENELVSDVVTILLVVLGGAAAEEVVGVDVSGIGGVGDGGGENGGSAFCPFLQYFFKDGGFHVHSVHRGLLRLVKYPL